ncbi:hypothetical protein DKX38_013114 [Salix brachista]|uniref:Imidazoleglycerol-phosphate dehydratase n=1 Tax=Salix brachista TaxID=2182728 RepID=A0A5N5LR16_9ROSI|nr:hypothetical protein DKX38_013114 [Salix brachista]
MDSHTTTTTTSKPFQANCSSSSPIEPPACTGVGEMKRVTNETNHGLFDVHVRATGDIHIDDHHTNEDVALAIGTVCHCFGALLQELGDRKGINRFCDFPAPLDEALIHVSLPDKHLVHEPAIFIHAYATSMVKVAHLSPLRLCLRLFVWKMKKNGIAMILLKRELDCLFWKMKKNSIVMMLLKLWGLLGWELNLGSEIAITVLGDVTLCMPNTHARGGEEQYQRFRSMIIMLFIYEMDLEDLSGRPYLGYDLQIPTQRVVTYDTQSEHLFQSLVNTSDMTLHIRLLAGRNSHHIIEATFKAFARALRQATEYDPRHLWTMSRFDFSPLQL